MSNSVDPDETAPDRSMLFANNLLLSPMAVKVKLCSALILTAQITNKPADKKGAYGFSWVNNHAAM